MASATDIPSLDVLKQQAKHETALVEFINFSVTPQSHWMQASILLFFPEIKITPDWRGLCPVYLSTLQNLVYRALRVLLWGQICCFVQLQWRNPDATVCSTSYAQWHSPLE